MDAPKFLFIAIFLIVCSTGVFLYPQQLQRREQALPSSRGQLAINTIQHNSVNFSTLTSPVITVPSATPVTVTPATTAPPATPTPPNAMNSPPLTPPSTNNPPSSGGAAKRWCIAKPDAPQTGLQTALDYACSSGADCQPIQSSGACYNPNSLVDHASYAFNSYYQKNPVPTSCAFNGAATITTTNPSTATCSYPTSSSSTSPTTPAPPTTTTPTPPMTTTPTTTTPTPPTGSSTGSATPPGILNGNNPPIGGIGGIPPITDTPSISMSTSLHHPFIHCIIVVTSFVTGVVVLDI